jgi:enterochelin esterase-like enzyme
MDDSTTQTSPEDLQFALDDPDHRLAAVRLWQEVRLPSDRLDFRFAAGAWRLTIPRQPVDRMEYLFELTHGDGGRETICDPTNPLRVGGAFGDHSVLEFGSYVHPAWLAATTGPGVIEPIKVDAPELGQSVGGLLWSPARLAPHDRAALLVVHDGPEYDQLARFTQYLAAMIELGRVAPMRAALLAPGPRDEWYSASGRYGRALTGSVLAALRARVDVTAVIGVGASLGALEMLMAHRAAPDAFDGLFLQSGSYFQRGLDASESTFSEFERIARNVSGVVASAGGRRPVPVVLTCGGLEENLGNNRAMARALAAQGYPVALHEVRDVHNYTAWRDALDPYLTNLMIEVVA